MPETDGFRLSALKGAQSSCEPEDDSARGDLTVRHNYNILFYLHGNAGL